MLTLSFLLSNQVLSQVLHRGGAPAPAAPGPVAPTDSEAAAAPGGTSGPTETSGEGFDADTMPGAEVKTVSTSCEGRAVTEPNRIGEAEARGAVLAASATAAAYRRYGVTL